MDVASLQSNIAYSCDGCGFCTKTVALYHRHIKRCIFIKLHSSLSPKENLEQCDNNNLVSAANFMSKLHKSSRSEEQIDSCNTERRRSLRISNGLFEEKQPSATTQFNSNNPIDIYDFEPSSNVDKFISRSCPQSDEKNNIAKLLKPPWLKRHSVGAPANRSRKRRYQCKKCNYFTNQSKQFLHHKLHIHKEKIQVHACNLCEYACNTKHKLHRHWRLIHACGPATMPTFDGSSNCLNQSKESLFLNDANKAATPNTNAQHEHDDIQIPQDYNVLLNQETSENISSNITNEGLQDDLDLDKEVADINAESFSMLDWIKMPLPAADTDVDYNVRESPSKSNIKIGGNHENENVIDREYQFREFVQHKNLFDKTKGRNFIWGRNRFGFMNSFNRNRINTRKHINNQTKLINKTDFNDIKTKLKSENIFENENYQVVLKDDIGVKRNFEMYIKILPGLGTKPIYGCTLCRFTHPIRDKVLQHISTTHKKKAFFKCNICNFTCKRRTEWTSHKINHSTKRIHSCEECSYRTNFYRNFARHMRHHNEKPGPVTCNYCSYSSTGEGAVQRHMREFHSKDQQEENKQEIMEQISAKGSVSMPVQTADIPKNPFVYEKSSLSTPLTVANRVDAAGIETPESPIFCPKCGLACKSKAHLSRHFVVHTNDQPFVCKLCGLKYKRLSDLNRHSRKKHPSGRVEVGSTGLSTNDDDMEIIPDELYESEFNSQDESGADFVLHEGSVEVPRTPELGLATANGQNEPLNLSVKKGELGDEDDDGNFDDDDDNVLPFQTLDNDSLLSLNVNNNDPVDMKISEAESLQCTVCTYIAKWPSDLKRHMLIHTANKNLKCSLCDKRFKHQGDLNKHLREKHGIPVGKPRKPVNEKQQYQNPWACLFCEFKCDIRDDMKLHLQALHEESVIQYGDLEHLVDQTYCLVVGEQLTPMVTDNGKVIQCPYCPYQTDAKSKMKIHIEIHGNLKRYMCSDCGKRSNWIWDVRKHIRKEHPFSALDVVQLSEEEARSTLPQYVSSLKKGTRASPLLPQSSPNLVPVSDSGSSFSESPAPVPSPISQRKISPKERIRPFKCSACGRRSNWKWDMSKHVSICPGAELIIMDAVEAKATLAECVSSPSGKTTQLKMNHKKMLATPDHAYLKKLIANKNRPFKCSICGKRSNWKWDLKKHIRNTHPGGQVIILTVEEAKAEDKLPPKKKKMAENPPHKPELKVKWNLFDQFKKIMPKVQKVESRETVVLKDRTKIVAQPTSVDNKRLKRFKCSVCNYRSNFKGDIKRHIQNFHEHIPGANIVFMPEAEAAATLSIYNSKFLGRRRDKPALPNKRRRPHSLPTPLSGVDLLRVVRASTPDSNSTARTDDDISYPSGSSSPQNVVVGGGMDTDELGRQESATSGILAKKNYYDCKHCTYWTTSRRTMEDHARCHSQGDLFSCIICGEKSDYRNSVVRHLRMKHKIGDPVEQRRHIKNIVTYKILIEQPAGLPHKGVAASKTEISDENLKSDSMDYNSAPNNDISHTDQQSPVVSMYRCKICGPGKSAINKYTVVRHLKKRHPEVTLFNNYIVKFNASQQPTPVSSDGPTGFCCTVCPFTSQKRARLRLHMENHKPLPGNKYKCRHCPYFVSNPRLLHSHIRLHLQQQGLIPDDKPSKIISPGTVNKLPGASQQFLTPTVNTTPTKLEKNGKTAFSCTTCPFFTFSKNDYLYHKQFHRPKPAAQYKCDLCPYWIKEKRLLGLHVKVHDRNYRTLRLAGKKVLPKPQQAIAQPSPCKSDISEMSLDDAVEIAHVKQQIIASKIKSVAVTPMKVRPEPVLSAEGDVIPSFILDKQLMVSGAYKKYHKCRYCPWTNVRIRNLRLHEAMHGVGDPRRTHKCLYCDYCVGNRGLLTHHIKVHSAQYRPGHDIINDVEDEPNTDSEQQEGDSSKEGILTQIDETETKERLVEQEGDKLDAQSLPDKSKFYLKYNDQAKAHILEKAILRKWCCEKCPYASMKKAQFENHVVLHGSRQQYVCQYCDYSVPGYHLLLTHEKLHRMPNPNLLNVQSISNLMRLPDIPADLAAAATGYKEDDPGHHDHMNTLFENSSQFSEPKKLYRCDRCPYTNIRREGLLSHLRCHMIRNEHRCNYCDYSVSKAHLLNQHVKIHFNLPGTEMSSQSPSKDDKWEFPIPEKSDQDCKENGITPKDKRKELVKRNTSANEESEESSVQHKTSDKASDDKGVNKTEEEKMDVCEDENENVVAGDDKRQQKNDKHTSCVNDSIIKPWICQYCDRAFQSLPKHNHHEQLHLLGTVH